MTNNHQKSDWSVLTTHQYFFSLFRYYGEKSEELLAATKSIASYLSDILALNKTVKSFSFGYNLFGDNLLIEVTGIVLAGLKKNTTLEKLYTSLDTAEGIDAIADFLESPGCCLQELYLNFSKQNYHGIKCPPLGRLGLIHDFFFRKMLF